MTDAKNAGAAQVGAPLAPAPLTYDEAREIAFRAAKAFRPSYFSGDDFEPHPWVVHAVISATTPGQRKAAKGGDAFNRPATASPSPAGQAVAWMHEWTSPATGKRESEARKHKPLDYELTPGDTVRALVFAEESAAASPGWKPIESAPKDKNIILSNGINVSEGGWVSDLDQGAEHEGQLGMAGWWAVEWPHEGGEVHPTFWMELPAAPDTSILPASPGEPQQMNSEAQP